MKKKLVLLSFSFCFLAAACGGKKEAGDEKPKAPAQRNLLASRKRKKNRKRTPKRNKKRKDRKVRQDSQNRR